MTDQCFDDEPDRGREPEPVPYVPENTSGYVSVYPPMNSTTTAVIHCSHCGVTDTITYTPEGETWSTSTENKVYRNVASKLELAKKYLREISTCMIDFDACDHNGSEPMCERCLAQEALKELEDE